MYIHRNITVSPCIKEARNQRAYSMSDDEMGTEMEATPTVPYLAHVKVAWDPALNWAKIADNLFDGDKVLVQYEKFNSSNPHCHLQGITTRAWRTFTNMTQQIAKEHQYCAPDPITGLRPKKRPVNKQEQFKTTERGFQYLMKEGHDPLYSRGFSPAELEELKLASQAHVHELKQGLQDYLHTKTFPTHSLASEIWDRMQLAACEYYKETETKLGRHHRFNLINAMITHPQATGMWKVYAAGKA